MLLEANAIVEIDPATAAPNFGSGSLAIFRGFAFRVKIEAVVIAPDRMSRQTRVTKEVVTQRGGKIENGVEMMRDVDAVAVCHVNGVDRTSVLNTFRRPNDGIIIFASHGDNIRFQDTFERREVSESSRLVKAIFDLYV